MTTPHISGTQGAPTGTLDDPTVFDICAPLPTGTTRLEASAGTG